MKQTGVGRVVGPLLKKAEVLLPVMNETFKDKGKACLLREERRLIIVKIGKRVCGAALGSTYKKRLKSFCEE